MSNRRKEIGSRSQGVRERRRLKSDKYLMFYHEWASLTIWVRISPTAAALITELLLDCEDGNYEPRQISLSEAAGKARVSEPTAYAALKELVEYNWLQKERDGDLKGPLAHRAAQYMITPPPHESNYHYQLFRKFRAIPAWVHLSNEGRKLFITLRARRKFRRVNKFPINVFEVKALLNCKDRKARGTIAELVEKGFLHQKGKGQWVNYSFTDMPRCTEQEATHCYRYWRPDELALAA